MTARSASPTSAGLRYTAERDIASNRHCRDIGSAGRSRSTSARRSARLICRAFVPKNRFRPSVGRSVDTEHRPAPRWPYHLPMRHPQKQSLHRPAAASSNCRSGSDEPELARQFGDRPIALDRRQRHLRLERRVVLLPCPLHVLLLRLRRFLGAGLHLSLLSHFRGPPQTFRIASLVSIFSKKHFRIDRRISERLRRLTNELR